MIIRFIILFVVFTSFTQDSKAQSDEKQKTPDQPVIISAYPSAKPTEDPEAVKHRNRGIEFAVKLENDKAIAEFSKAIEIDPKFSDAYNRRGASYSNKGDNERAISDFNKAIELDPKNDVAYLNRGSLYLIKKEYELAIADFTKLIEFFPKSEINYIIRANVYDKIGRKNLAAADRQKVRALRETEKNKFEN